jgi:hypothetical protein
VRPSSKTAARALDESPLAGLLEQALLLGRVASLVAEISPETADAAGGRTPVRCSLEGRTLVIAVRNPSQAAKLRQRTAELERRLRQNLPELTGIRIRHQPAEAAEADLAAATQDPEPRPAPDREYLTAALKFAEDLSGATRDSPLRRSARRLKRALKEKLAQPAPPEPTGDPERR